jgi:hypothetical protein
MFVSLEENICNCHLLVCRKKEQQIILTPQLEGHPELQVGWMMRHKQNSYQHNTSTVKALNSYLLSQLMLFHLITLNKHLNLKYWHYFA